MMKCNECRFWSEMLARSDGVGPVLAVCLCSDSKMEGEYTSGRSGCSAGKESVFGAIDQPCHDPNEIKWRYEQYDLGGSS